MHNLNSKRKIKYNNDSGKKSRSRRSPDRKSKRSPIRKSGRSKRSPSKKSGRSIKKSKLKLIKIVKSTRPEKKYMAIFEKNGKRKTTHFGSFGMSDFTKHKDLERKKRYLSRHRKNENWNDPTTAGALSKNILWNKPTLRASIVDYKRRFHFN